jgi:hypothetical protein
VGARPTSPLKNIFNSRSIPYYVSSSTIHDDKNPLSTSSLRIAGSVVPDKAHFFDEVILCRI